MAAVTQTGDGSFQGPDGKTYLAKATKGDAYAFGTFKGSSLQVRRSAR